MQRHSAKQKRLQEHKHDAACVLQRSVEHFLEPADLHELSSCALPVFFPQALLPLMLHLNLGSNFSQVLVLGSLKLLPLGVYECTLLLVSKVT